MTPHPLPTKEFSVLMAAMMSLVAISIDALLPALGLIGADMRVSNPNHVQLLISGIFGGMAAGQLIVGPLSDAFGRKPILYAGIVIYLAGSILGHFADSFGLLIASRLIQGLGVAAPYVTAISVVRDKYSGRNMARIMSLVMMIFIMVPAVAPSLGQAVLHITDWRGIFLLYIVYAVSLLAWVGLRLEETLTPEKRMNLSLSALRQAFTQIVGNKTTMYYTLCTGLIFGSFIGYLGASQQIFQEQFAVGESFALYFGALAVVFGVASLTNSRIVMKVGMRAICRNGLAVVVLAALVFLAVHALGITITLPMFIVYAVVTFFSFGMLFGNLNAVAMEPMGEVAGMAAAIIGSSSSLISLCLGTLIGQLYDNTLIPILLGFAASGSICWVIVTIEQRGYRAVAA